MIVAITGGSGFIGHKLSRSHLQRGDEVRLLSRWPGGTHPKDVRLFEGDLTGDIRRLESFADGADVLYHCAAEVVAEERMEAVNATGTRQLCRAAACRIGHWVQLGSIGIYDTQAAETITEESPDGPVGAYERSKLAADRAVQEAGQHGWFSYTILRPSIVYGATMPNRSLYELIRIIDRGLFFFIGGSGASANYIHVNNVVFALMLCAQSRQARGRIYNLSDHRTMEAFVGSIAGHLGRRAPIVRLPGWLAMGGAKFLEKIPGMPLTVPRVRALTSRIRFPCDRIQRELGYKHGIDMEQGLLEMVSTWRQMKGK